MRTATMATILGCVLAGGAEMAADKPNTVPSEACTGRLPPPEDMASWTSPADLTAARGEAELAKSVLIPGKAITAKLVPVGDVKFRARPEKADGPATYGGLYALRIVAGGTYRIASSAAPWMDVFIGTSPVKSASFGHGPACTGIGKMVDFPLPPGDYLVQLSESLKPDIEIMVVQVTPNSPPPQR
jgi:hypothetical protein